MTKPAFIDADELSRLLPVAAAVDALQEAFASGAVESPARSHHEVGPGTLLTMPAWDERHLGVKLVTVNPDGPRRGLPLIGGLYALFDASSLQPVALIDGAALTALRTAAVSALATRHLARRGSRRLAIFGAGTQARSHLAAMRGVLDLADVTIVSRTESRARRLVDRARDLGLDANLGTPASVAEADVVCTCTTSSTPVFDGSLLKEGAHVNAVGAFRPETRELDDEVMRRARVVVESREAALSEAGDLLLPLGSGVIDDDSIVAELPEVVRGAPVRQSDADITVFKSVGMALEDLAVARAAIRLATGAGSG